MYVSFEQPKSCLESMKSPLDISQSRMNILLALILYPGDKVLCKGIPIMCCKCRRLLFACKSYKAYHNIDGFFGRRWQAISQLTSARTQVEVLKRPISPSFSRSID